MNFSVFMDTQSKQFLTNFEKDYNLRPVVGDVIRITTHPNLFKITRQEPALASPTPEPITFFVRVLNSSPDSKTMGADIAKLTRTLRHLGR